MNSIEFEMEPWQGVNQPKLEISCNRQWFIANETILSLFKEEFLGLWKT